MPSEPDQRAADHIGPLAPFLGRGIGSAIGSLASRAYGLEIGRRNRAFDQGRGVVRLDRPVISVGNLSVGGTGKTPMVEWIVRRLLEAGRRPCIAMRGYRGGEGGGDFVDGDGGKSDEAAGYRAALPDVPIVAQADRTAGLRVLFASDEGRDVDCVVLDDGFQHRRLARDLDIVLLDATRSPLTDRLLPAGWLREPLESLRRASMVVITRCDQGDAGAIDAGVRGVLGRGADATCRHAWRELCVRRREADGGGDVAEPVEFLRARRVCLVCAIGNPGAFRRQALAHGARIVGEMVLPDHDPYEAQTIERIESACRESDAEAVLTTAKDWTKLRGRGLGLPVIHPRLEIVFERGGEAISHRVLEAAAPADG